ncbi:recombinase family protein, partial [Asticcacaulis endophyticus]|uniref:recombinase family protein n=1 Tax=Asticcacaulis endophyticus TaxID=1395890 RepID=UPI0016756ACF
MRAVIYSRYSTDLQNERSIADQEAMARAYADRNGLTILRTYADAAQSGASMINRDGLQDLMADAKHQLFSVVLVESLDRLSRDMEDLAGIHKRLTFAGIKIIALHEGEANSLTVGLRGIIGQMFREDNVHKTKRGMKGKVDQGLIAAGAAYGYRLTGEKKGHAEIDEDQADIIRRIFSEYIAGKSPRDICTRLNNEKINGPRGKVWLPSAIYGWEKRGTGILRNPLYIGKIVWNRTHFIKDPDTGSRISRVNPRSEWHYGEAPHLRILDQKTWDDAQALCAGRTKTPAEAGTSKRPKRLLSGLLKCGACGGGMSAFGADRKSRTRIMCSRHRDGVTCPNPKTYYLDEIEPLVIDALKEGLRDPEMLAEYVREYNAARVEFARAAHKRRDQLEKRVTTLNAQAERILQLLIKNVGNEERLGEQMNATEAELQAAREELAREPAPVDVVAIHPGTIARYEAGLNNLRDELTKGLEHSPAQAQILREMVHSITLTPNPDPKGRVILDIQGNLRLLL